MPVNHALALLVLLGSAAVACSEAGGDAASGPFDVVEGDPTADAEAPALTSDEVAAPGPYAVGVITLRLEDTSRPTAPNGDFEGAPSRSLPTEVWYPAGPATPTGSPVREAEPAADGPFPVLVYSHGFMSSRRENTELASHLATLGYVVAAPEFPLTSTNAPGGPNLADMVNQPADIRFVIDALLAQGSRAESPFGRVDPERVGLLGVSMGAMTSLITSFHPDHRDPRVRAVLAAAAPGCYLPGDFFAGVSMPVLFLHGDLDEIVPYAENAVATYGFAGAPKWLVTLRGGTHTAFGAVAVDILSRLDNPEAVGCAALATNGSLDEASLAELVEAFSGGSGETPPAECPVPCAGGGERPTAMNARRQLDLVRLVVVAFFADQLGGEARYGEYLDHGLAREQSDVTVSATRRGPGP